MISMIPYMFLWKLHTPGNDACIFIETEQNTQWWHLTSTLVRNADCQGALPPKERGEMENITYTFLHFYYLYGKYN